MPAVIIIVVALIFLGVVVVVAVKAQRRKTQEAPADDDAVIALRRGWQEPQEARFISIPRSVQISRGGISSLIIMGVIELIFVAFGAVVWFQATRDQQKYALLAQDGARMDAVVTDKQEHHGKSTWYKLSYRYTVRGNSYSNTADVPSSMYRVAERGRTIPIRYARSQPSSNAIDGTNPDSPYVAVAFAVPFLLVVVAVVASARREQRLLEYGTFAPALVTRVGPTKGGSAVRYRFADAAGHVRTGNATVPTASKPNVGDTITVIHDPDRPQRAKRYPLDWVRLAN